MPEKSAIKRLITRHVRVAPSVKAQRIAEIEKAIERKEKAAMKPIREYIEKQIAAGAGMTRSYFEHKGMRKQNWFAYWKVIEEGLDFREEEMKEWEEPGYDESALSQIHAWLTKELHRAFSGWGIGEEYDIFIAEEFTAPYKTRTFEFGLIRTGNVDPANVPYEETYYYLVYYSGKVKAYEMWRSHYNAATGKYSGVNFDYMGFNREMRRIGAWK